MDLLKLMTFNVQLPSPIMAAGQMQDDRAVEHANKVADAIMALPVRDQPDVIAFNEVFSEPGRDTMVTRLGGMWPNVLKKIDDGSVGEDSGLMLFSKFPFQPLPNGDTSATHTYENSAGKDSGANKAVGLVRIATPVKPTHIVFTHTQASYNADNSDNVVERDKQLDEIMQFLKDILGNSESDWLNVVLIGDLNIKGDPGATTDEWDRVFVSGTIELGKVFSDGWREHMHNPGSLKVHDPGITQRETDAGKLNRLDYQLFCKLPPDNRRIVPHHIFTPLRTQSDHWSLLSRIQHVSKHCTPATAIDILSTPSVSVGSVPGHVSSDVHAAVLNIQDPGACQWIFVSKPGTYSVFDTASAEIVYFSEDDFTHPLARLDQISINDLPPDVQAGLRHFKTFVPKGQTVVSRTPFFIRVRGKNDAFVGADSLGLVTHRGDSQATAISLFPNVVVDPDLPKNETLGSDDTCWFRADIPAKFDGGIYTTTFVLNNPANVNVKLKVRDAATNPVLGLAPAVQAPPLLSQPFDSAGETVFVTLQRAALTEFQFTMEMVCPLTFLWLDQPFVLHVDDETGPDWAGSDSLAFSIVVDTQELLTDSWDDADSGEDWPDLAKLAQQNAIAKSKSLSSDVSFTTDLMFSLLKTDGITAHGSVAGTLEVLNDEDEDIAPRTVDFVVPDSVSDGHLTFSCTLSKFPSGH